MLSSKYYSKSHAKTQMISIGILRKKCKNMPNGTKGLAVLFPKNGMPIRTVNSIPIYRICSISVLCFFGRFRLPSFPERIQNTIFHSLKLQPFPRAARRGKGEKFPRA